MVTRFQVEGTDLLKNLTQDYDKRMRPNANGNLFVPMRFFRMRENAVEIFDNSCVKLLVWSQSSEKNANYYCRPD